MQNKNVSSKKQNHSVTMEDIAKEAGISRRAVSRALFPDKSKSVRVSEQTAKKVRKIAERVGYFPNLNARQLKSKKSKLIGILIDTYATPVFHEVIQHLESMLRTHQYRLLIGQVHEDVNSIREYLSDFMGRGVEGVISYIHSYPEATKIIKKLCEQIQNTVYVGEPVVSTNQVLVDIANGTRMAVKHLWEGGRRNIALFLTLGGYASMETRRVGFLEEIQRLNFNSKNCPVWFHKRRDSKDLTRNPPQATIHESLYELLKSFPSIDAIIASNDIIALSCIQFLEHQKISVPEEIAIVGFDNMEFSSYTSPSLTSIDQSTEQVAKQIVKLLLEGIKGKKEKREAPILIQPKLICRQSTENLKV